MNQTYRIGLRIFPGDPFWVQVREAAVQRGQQHNLEIVQVAFDDNAVVGDAAVELLDEFKAQELDALITHRLPRRLGLFLLHAGLPLVYTEETNLSHPLLTAPRGLYDAAQMAAAYLKETCQNSGHILIVSGDEHQTPTLVTRLSGFLAFINEQSNMNVDVVYAPWRYTDARTTLQTLLAGDDPPFDPTRPVAAVFGLSDPLALAARDVGRAMGFVDDRTKIAGINGDPLALAAIVAGQMHATIETGANELGFNAVDHAYMAATGNPLPTSFPYRLRLVTQENVAQVSSEKLLAIAELPSRLVDVNQRQEQQRLRHVETSLAITARAGAALVGTLDIHELAELIGTDYGYDQAQLLLWDDDAKTLIPWSPRHNDASTEPIPLAEALMLGHALLQNRPIYVPDCTSSHRFPPDPRWPETRSRVTVPIRHGQRRLGLLDLHSHRRLTRSRAELDALQSLADQLGGALQNARLYANALAAKGNAEKADQLKTRLLTNVSHELRTPLNIILGYSVTALEEPNPYSVELPAALKRDLHHIQHSGEDLMQLINDLLDLSQAESGTLTVYPELVDLQSFLTDLFDTVVSGLRRENDVQWQLNLAQRLPAIMADPVRLRQILYNLLSNAAKFTDHGRITLGAKARVDEVHIWVEDTGRGIPSELIVQIFDAFVSAQATNNPVDRRQEGIGLGLSIARQLTQLHGAQIKIDSLLGSGTTCHLYWPLSEEKSVASSPRSSQPGSLPLAILLDEMTTGVGPLVKRAVDYIHTHYADEISRQALAEAVGASPAYVTRVFREQTGLTPWQYLNRYRVAQAQRLLRESDATITEIAGLTGFNDSAYFSRIFRRECGSSPNTFRNQTN